MRLVCILGVLIASWGMGSASAGFILIPTNGIILFDGSDPADEDTAKRIINLNLNYYGSPVTEAWVSENGNLNFSGDGGFFPDPLGSPSLARIAPLWDDFLLLQDSSRSIDNRVLLHSQPGQYLAVTWENVRLFNETVAGDPFPATPRSAQVVWFESDQIIRGFQFRKDDIAFGYRAHVPGTPNFGDLFATVGLDSGQGSIAPLPGTTDGFITSNGGGLLAWEPDSFLLFRPTDILQTNYSGSKQFFSAVPEPSSGWLALAAMIGLLWRGRAIAKGSDRARLPETTSA